MKAYFTWGADPELDEFALNNGKKMLADIENAKRDPRRRMFVRELQRRFDMWCYSVANTHGDTYLGVMARLEA